jgi:hypothetical protein
VQIQTNPRYTLSASGNSAEAGQVVLVKQLSQIQRLDAPIQFEISGLETEPPASPERPVNPDTGHGNAGDVAADLSLEGSPPWREAEAETVLHHGELAADEIGRADQRSRDVVDGFSRGESQTARLRQFRPDAGDFLLLKP